jgi:hypothetical protein
MTAVMHDVARASLPVAIALLILASTARAALAARLDDERASRLAAQYLEPLATWCLVALATHTLALGLAGEAGALSVALPLALGAAAVILRVSGEAPERPAATRAATVAPAPAAAPGAAPAPAAPWPTTASTDPAPGPLWADPIDDESTRRTGLWSRA